MSERSRDVIDCGNCVGACCRGGAVTYHFDSKEVDLLKWAGTELEMFLPADPDHDWTNRSKLKRVTGAMGPGKGSFTKKRAKQQIKEPGYGLYGIKPGTNCGFAIEVDEGKLACGIHDMPEMMPKVCREFTAGSRNCRDVRERFGVGMDTAEINLNLARVALGEEQLITFGANTP